MKLQIISDIHLNVCPLDPPVTDADIVVVAGDVARPEVSAAWVQGFPQTVLYVPGNHEFYDSSLGATRAELHRLCDGTRVQVLDKQVYEQDGVRFLGTTLWTDFLVNGPGAPEREAMDKAQQYMKDFRDVTLVSPAGERTLTPADTTELFAENVRWLERQLAAPWAGKTVVITHHAPARGSIHPNFAGSTFNPGFVSDLERLMDGERIQLWIHGHTHNSADYVVNGTRVLCNPRGYVKNGRAENPAFQPRLMVDLG